MTPKDRIELYRQQKLAKRKEQKLSSYYKNRNLKQKEYKTTQAAIRQRKHRAQVQQKREKEKLRKREYRKMKYAQKDKHNQTQEALKYVFENRTTKHRALKKLKDALPRSPEKCVATLATYLKYSKSPTVKSLQSAELISSPEELVDNKTAKAVLDDIKVVIDNCKMEKSEDSAKAMNVLVASKVEKTSKKKKKKKKMSTKFG